MGVNEGLVVTGIPELTRALKALDPEAAKELTRAMKDIAKVIVSGAQARMEFGPGKAASSLKAGGGVRGAWITFPRGRAGSGSDPVGYYPWLDFGGGAPFGRGVTRSDQTSGHRKTDWTKVGYSGFRREIKTTGGRYLYPAVDDARRSGFIKEAAVEALNRARKRLQFDGEGF